MKEFKVADFDKYNFKPSVVVTEICQIYLNLSDSEKFCKAITKDGRSFSPKLFPQAKDVLLRIGESHDKVQAFQDFTDSVMVSEFQSCVLTSLVGCSLKHSWHLQLHIVELCVHDMLFLSAITCTEDITVCHVMMLGD